jgi:ATP-binding cassette subfamily B protein RaxB
MSIFFKLATTTLTGAQSLALFYHGGGSVISGTMTVGMLLAFTSYATSFSSRGYSLIDAFISFQMLSLHCERLADIALERQEEDFEARQIEIFSSPLVEVRKLGFRYAEGEPWVVRNVDLTIYPGENIALIGPSGCGKSTIIKIILGILKPSEGEILFDGISQRQIGIRKCRDLIGSVSQDDALVSGSIADNISFFDTHLDFDFLQECAKHAAIHDDISLMPMGYQTLVGDMGTSLSGGQKQRILLARALYKRPVILVLDEATSHLDMENEMKINLALSKIGITKIVVAHRKETINEADRLFCFELGNFREITSKLEEIITPTTHSGV